MFIQEIHQICITILVDNSTYFLLVSSEHTVRPPLVRNEKFVLSPPVAEHGFSALITIPGPEEGSINSFLFDTGVSAEKQEEQGNLTETETKTTEADTSNYNYNKYN